MAKLIEYFNPNWRDILHNAKLDNFEAIWNLEFDWFEEPNIRRGGWSGVIKYPLNTTKGITDIFIKRQENHISKTLRHPIKGIATFQKEFHNIQALTQKKAPTLELVYFGQRDQQAILITQSLDAYCALDSTELYTLDLPQKPSLLTRVAAAMRLLHQHHFQHNCLYPKHIFVSNTDKGWDVKFIDLEKLKRTPLKRQAVIRDLFTLYRHADKHWTTKDRVYFFKAYMNENKLSPKSKKLWHSIAKKIAAKNK